MGEKVGWDASTVRDVHYTRVTGLVLERAGKAWWNARAVLGVRNTGVFGLRAILEGWENRSRNMMAFESENRGKVIFPHRIWYETEKKGVRMA